MAFVVIPTSRAAYDLHVANSPQQLRTALERLINAARYERETLLPNLRAQVGGRPECNILDFIYYSAVTLTTLGYGDILPNSTAARFVVMVNSVFGFFSGFALIILWPTSTKGYGL